ncbi:MAG: FAD-dependent monooxygenase [Pseudomonadota bacterium]
MDKPVRRPIVQSMSEIHDIVVVGGGLNGRLLSLAAAQAGLSLAVLDKEPAGSLGYDGRSYALALTSVNVLRALDLWDALGPMAEPILDIKVTTGRPGQGAAPFFMHFDHAELEEGPMGHMVEDVHLRAVLDAAIAEEDRIEWISDANVIGQEVDGGKAAAVLSDGRVIEARLLVGADGRGSKVAQRAGLSKVAWDYDQTALVCVIAHEKPHQGVAHQFFAPAGPLAVLPLQGNRSSIVWSETTAIAAQIMEMDETGYLSALRPLIGAYLGEIALEGVRYSYPLGLSVARQFVGERLALLGDAAHGIHPLAGQGLNLGIRDTAALVEVSAAASRRGQDIGSADVLRHYQRWRRPDAVALALATDQLNRLFSNSNPGLAVARSVGLGLVNAVPNLRRGFMRQAAGLKGDLPKLMRGQAV